jgi:uridine kinase
VCDYLSKTQMEREELLAFLVEEIVGREEKSRPLKVGIDGRCASGKSILANELASALGPRGLEVLRPSVDGFHHPRERRYRQGEYSAAGYYEDAYDYQAVIDSLLRPLSGSVFPVACRQIAHDVRTDMPDAAPPIRVGAGSVLLFEGLFLFRRELNAYWDFRILLDIDPATTLSRALDRDTGVIGPAEVVRRKYEARYEPAWQIYVNEEHPESKADVIVDNRDFLHPQVLKPASVGAGRIFPRGPGALRVEE